MNTNIINGTNILKLIQNKIKKYIKKKNSYRKPIIAVINIGNNAPSKIYVYEKKKACNKSNIQLILFNLRDNINQKSCLDLIKKLNKDKFIDGILIQLPLPNKIKINEISKLIKFKKDIDGFHPYNFGKLAIGYKSIIPCTCLSVLKILKGIKKTFNSLCIVII